MNSYLSVKELSTITGIHPQTIYRKCKTGDIECEKIGRTVLIHAEPFKLKVKHDENVDVKDFVFSKNSQQYLPQLKDALMGIAENA